MQKQSTTFNEQRTGVLTLLHASLTEVDNHHTTLERKLQYNMVLMSSIAALELAIHLLLLKEVGLQLPKPIIGAALLFALTYLGVAAISLCAIWPQSRGSLPFEPTWDKVNEWWGYSIIDYRNKILSSYVKIWEENQKLLDNKVRWTQYSYVLVVLSLSIVIFQALLYRHHFVVLSTFGSPIG